MNPCTPGVQGKVISVEAVKFCQDKSREVIYFIMAKRISFY